MYAKSVKRFNLQTICINKTCDYLIKYTRKLAENYNVPFLYAQILCIPYYAPYT